MTSIRATFTMASVTCPAGQYVISGGFMITELTGTAPEILGSYPVPADTWMVIADATTGRYDLTAIAMCAELPGQTPLEPLVGPR